MGKEVAKQTEEDYSIKPQAVTPALDTSSWPLLLKNYEKRKYYPDLKYRSRWFGEMI